MSLCPITYKETENGIYSREGLNLINRSLTSLEIIPLTQDELRSEAVKYAAGLPFSGRSPKLLLNLNLKLNSFYIAPAKGKFILKPQSVNFASLPENESLTMHLAKEAGIEIPDCGLLLCLDNTFSFFVKRFDITRKKENIHIESFESLSGENNTSLETLPEIIDKHCTFPVLEKIKLFRVVLFNYLIGNTNAHSGKFSLETCNDIIKFSPFYGMRNTVIINNSSGEFVLSVNNKKTNLDKIDLIDYFGKQVLRLNKAVVLDILNNFESAIDVWAELTGRSFLPPGLKEKYFDVLGQRIRKLFS
jgi:serine/threonine-protein kinase HipA